MDLISKVTKLVLSVGALILAISALILALRYDARPAHGVAVGQGNMSSANIYTQSADGKTLYQWEFDSSQRKWKRWDFSQSGR